MINQDIKHYIFRGTLIKEEYDDKTIPNNDIIVLEEYDGDMMLLETEDTLLSLTKVDTKYSLIDFLISNITEPSGFINVNFITVRNIWDTINPFIIKQKANDKMSFRIQYNTNDILKFHNDLYTAMKTKMGDKAFVYMEISISQNI